MKLERFYLGDPRLVLVPVEHLSATGIGRELAALLRERAAWSDEKLALFDAAFALYSQRSEALSRRTSTWAPPRLRNVAVLADGQLIPPYVQLLNASTWTLYDCDFDPRESHAEFAAYLLAHGERMALSGEATLAALHNAAYWFDRDAAEIAAFQDAARRSRRPDAAAFRALADALEWLPALAHETLRPPPNPRRHRAIPDTGLLVPPPLEDRPPRLVDAWTAAANGALHRYFEAWRKPDAGAQQALLAWLAADAPPLLITGKGNRILWDPQHPQRQGALRTELRRGGAAALADIAADLRVVASHTRAFTAALRDPAALPAPAASIAQDGYTYLYRGRKILAYNLHEPGLRRLEAPALPFARLMLGARAAHEWAHLAVEAGWVAPAVDDSELADRFAAVAQSFDALLSAAPAALRAHTRSDLAALLQEHRPATAAAGDERALVRGDSAGAALLRMIVPRLADYKANLLAVRLQSEEEREAYVRQNIRSLRGEYRSTELWRMLARQAYEYQYLRFSQMMNPRQVFLSSTWFAADFLRSGAVSEAGLDALLGCFAALCDAYEVDASRFSFP